VFRGMLNPLPIEWFSQLVKHAPSQVAGRSPRVPERTVLPLIAEQERAAWIEPGARVVHDSDNEDRPCAVPPTRARNRTNEFAGYLPVAVAALASGEIAVRYGLRPEPFISALRQLQSDSR